ncbi:MAG: threonylcarbamoyl-AMP synthase [Rhodobacteraceae bacterium]|jgi:L-threonylcarbamoyladenylate synthase|nr:threonylcarbamoyl-AMP synthase [Paracoccaceae bacterium]|tara:strand:+ start:2790 stop:3767 length:978 start_codon:yes stop_codon:yes gene_type:complete
MDQARRNVKREQFVKTKNLGTNSEDIDAAVSILRLGGLVAIPTETVYGLAADATNENAVLKIFEAKGRPAYNPLIIHVKSTRMAEEYIQWNDAAQTLAEKFWPGPLTIVLPSRINSKIAKTARASLPSIAVRMPNHPVALNILDQLDRPLAAPSANMSGKISSTSADHVFKNLNKKIDAIIDGGSSSVGVESTIVAFQPQPTILRAGAITPNAISNEIGSNIHHYDKKGPIIAPGQLKSHYAPNANLRLNAIDWKQGEKKLGFGNVKCDLNLSKDKSLTEAAQNLFNFLHLLDSSDPRTISVSPIPNEGIGLAINDRLRRASLKE